MILSMVILDKGGLYVIIMCVLVCLLLFEMGYSVAQASLKLLFFRLPLQSVGITLMYTRLRLRRRWR